MQADTPSAMRRLLEDLGLAEKVQCELSFEECAQTLEVAGRPALVVELRQRGVAAGHATRIASAFARRAREALDVDGQALCGLDALSTCVSSPSDCSASSSLASMPSMADCAEKSKSESSPRACIADATVADVGVKGADLADSLAEACAHGREDVILALLHSGGVCDVVSRSGLSALGAACAFAWPHVVEALLIARAAVEARASVCGSTALQLCAAARAPSDRSLACIALLVGRRALLDVARRDGSTALTDAVCANEPARARALLDARANAAVRLHRQWTPLHVAALHGHASCAAALLAESGADDGRGACDDRFARDGREARDSSDAHGGDGVYSDTGAHGVGESEEVGVTTDGRRSMADAADEDGISPLWVAACLGRHECMAVLLDARADAATVRTPPGRPI